MGKNNYVPPKRNVRISSGRKNHLTSSHQKPYNKDGTPAHHRAVHPDEAQQQAATELNPAFVNPDGSINFWAGFTATQEPTNTNEDDSEDK